jgi:glycosyltransferase involved in cell wall biosynthesis
MSDSDWRTTLSVIIPALNEEASIADIVLRIKAVDEELRRVGIENTEILVVDDGSRDRTSQIVAMLPGVRLLRHSGTRGYGAALKTGFCHARGELLAFLDADGTYPPEELPVLCQAVIEQKADIVVGSRRSGSRSRMPLLRRLGNFLWSNLVSLIGSCRCVDPASGMRVLRRSVLPRLYPLPDGLNFTPVMSTRAVHEALKVIELPIAYHERTGRSKLSIIDDGSRFLKTILWTALEYNPAKILGFVGIAFVSVAVLIGLGLTVMRASGVTTLGAWGAFSVFAALVLSVSGISIYFLGVTSNFLVSLFHRQPMRQGLFANSVFEKLLEPHFGWMGGFSIGLGLLLGVVSMIVGGSNWDVTRIWFWLLGSALFVLVGFQLSISWMVTQVLKKLAEREAKIDQELQSDLADSMSETGPGLGTAGFRPVSVTRSTV